MKIECPHCQSRARITHHNKISKKMSDVYVNCTNHECGARSVMRISHAYDLTPPASTLTDAIHEILANMSDEERRNLVRQYAPDRPGATPMRQAALF